MKKLFLASFRYNSGIMGEIHCAIIRAFNKNEAVDIFNNKIGTIFSDNEDVCTLTSIVEIADDVDLVFMKGGSYWVR